MMTLSPKDLLPHAHPMILLDAIEEAREQGLVASVTVRHDALFAEPQGVPAWVGLEYMGQAIAAYGGWCARQEERPVSIGFLVGTRRYEPGCSHFPFGVKLEIAVEALASSVGGLQVFACRITGSGILVSANLNVFVPGNVDVFLQEASSGRKHSE